MSDERTRRVGLNEAIFRQVNEQIRGLNRDFGTQENTMTVICECGDADCTERLVLRARDYERVRSDSRHYVIARGHEIPDVETVIEEADGYDVVRKNEGEAAELSRETDPRS
jgi:hypothetical protein